MVAELQTTGFDGEKTILFEQKLFTLLKAF